MSHHQASKIKSLCAASALLAAMCGLQTVASAAAPDAGPRAVGQSPQAQLVGRWVRTDGGYVIDIKNAGADGKLNATYFNPRPINVGRAEWSHKDGKLTAVVELRDANYPGSIYTLQYLPDQKQLAGNYYQAVQGNNYKVEFVRQEQK